MIGSMAEPRRRLARGAAWTALALGALLLVAACSALGGSPVSSTVRLSGADNGTAFTARVGDTIVIALAENPSTGFRWDVAQGVGKVLTLVSSTYAAPAATPLPGEGGTRTFTFRAAATGGAHLVLKYWRPSVGDSSIANQFTITVEVGS